MFLSSFLIKKTPLAADFRRLAHFRFDDVGSDLHCPRKSLLSKVTIKKPSI